MPPPREKDSKMTTVRFLRALMFLPLSILAAAAAAAQCCGDCDRNGQVTVDELIQSVNNALDNCFQVPTPVGSSSPAPTPTPLPDQCATDAPGARLTVLGTHYVIVEVEVVLEHSPQAYLIRYPVPVDATGKIGNGTYITNPLILKESPCSSGSQCDTLGSICGFSTRFMNATTVGTYYQGGVPQGRTPRHRPACCSDDG